MNSVANRTEMVIEIEVKSVYGEEKAYPGNEAARIFCEMLGTKTLTRQALTNIAKLGYAVEVKKSGSFHL